MKINILPALTTLLLVVVCSNVICNAQQHTFKPSNFDVPPGSHESVGGRATYGKLGSKHEREYITFYNNNGKIYTLDWSADDVAKDSVLRIWDEINRAYTRDTVGYIPEVRERIDSAYSHLELNRAKWKTAVVKYNKVDSDGRIRDFKITVDNIVLPDSIEVEKYKITSIGKIERDGAFGWAITGGWQFEGPGKKVKYKRSEIKDDFMLAGYTMEELHEIYLQKLVKDNQ